MALHLCSLFSNQNLDSFNLCMHPFQSCLWSWSRSRLRSNMATLIPKIKCRTTYWNQSWHVWFSGGFLTIHNKCDCWIAYKGLEYGKLWSVIPGQLQSKIFEGILEQLGFFTLTWCETYLLTKSILCCVKVTSQLTCDYQECRKKICFALEKGYHLLPLSQNDCPCSLLWWG